MLITDTPIYLYVQYIYYTIYKLLYILCLYSAIPPTFPALTVYLCTIHTLQRIRQHNHQTPTLAFSPPQP